MLIASLVLSLILILLVRSAACDGRRGIVAAIAFGALVLSFNGMIVLCGFLFQASLILLLAAVWRWSVSSGRFMTVVYSGTFCIYLVLAIIVISDEQRLRARFPYESLAERLPKRQLSAGASTPIEERFNAKLADLWFGSAKEAEMRSDQFELLHEDTVQSFISSPGFGITRHFLSAHRESFLTDGNRTFQPAPQPGRRAYFLPSTGDTDPSESVPWNITNPLLDLHVASYRDFTFPGGFGYFKDRQHVAGFLAHGMSGEKLDAGQWSLQTVDLVSMVLNDPFVVYVSDELPRMKNIRNTPTRPLDLFEADGVRSLKGEMLFLRKKDDHLRMLGAIRAQQQCVKCHDCNVGDLLGAFSYTLK